MEFDRWWIDYCDTQHVEDYGLQVAPRDAAEAAWNAVVLKAISVVETYRVSVGNSAAGEMAAEWTMGNLREIREELREMVSNAGIQPPPVGGRLE